MLDYQCRLTRHYYTKLILLIQHGIIQYNRQIEPHTYYIQHTNSHVILKYTMKPTILYPKHFIYKNIHFNPCLYYVLEKPTMLSENIDVELKVGSPVWRGSIWKYNDIVFTKPSQWRSSQSSRDTRSTGSWRSQHTGQPLLSGSPISRWNCRGCLRFGESASTSLYTSVTYK